MHGGQGMDALRHVNGKLDRLIEVLNSQPRSAGGMDPFAGVVAGGGGGGGGPDISPQLIRLAGILDAGQLHAEIVQVAMEVTKANRGFLTMLEENNKLRFKWGQNIDQSTLASPAFAYGRGLIKQVLQTGQPLKLPPAQGGGMHVLCVPLRFGERTQGTKRTAGAVFLEIPPASASAPEQMLTLATHVGDAGSTALENAQLLALSSSGDKDQILRLKDNITKLYDVGQSISSTLILDELLVLICDHVVNISRAQRGFIMLVGEQEKFLGRNARKRDIPRDEFRYSTTVVRKCLEGKESQIHKELPEADLSVSMVQMELQSILTVPLKEKDEVIGLVYVDSQQSNKEFDESDREIVESLCGQASIAIVNAKLYEEAKERERLAHELELASKIQSDLLPKTIPNVRGLQLHGLLQPATEVGGDYYDFIPHEGTEDSLSIAIGDVSGKGVGAGLVMAMCRSALRSLVQYEGAPTTPLSIMRSLNLIMVRDIPPQMFMTLNVLVWNADTRTLKYTPAGHEHLLVYRAQTREVESIRAGGMACGVVKEASQAFQERELELAPGDHLLLYTDGVTEAMNVESQQFGLDTTIELVRRGGHTDPKTLCEGIHQQIVKFRGEALPHDDITLVALRAT